MVHPGLRDAYKVRQISDWSLVIEMIMREKLHLTVFVITAMHLIPCSGVGFGEEAIDEAKKTDSGKVVDPRLGGHEAAIMDGFG